MGVVVLALACSSVACREPQVTPPNTPVLATPTWSDDPVLYEPEPEQPDTLTPLGELGIAVTLPEGATVRVVPDHPNRQVDVTVAASLVQFVRVELPPPASLDDALSDWSHDSATFWARGTGSGGGYYAGTTFAVRVGYSRGGMSIHRVQDVSRAHGVIAVGENAIVRCTGYVEAGLRPDGSPPPPILALVDVCASMRVVEQAN